MPRSAIAAVALCLTATLAGCSSDDGTMRDAGGPRPNGVAGMKPAQAVAAATKAMSELHDAVYESTMVIALDGKSRRVKVVETVTADGCVRVLSHAELGRIWVRVIGRTMWLKTNDRAAEALGRTSAQVELFRGRWLEYPAPDLLRGCDLGYLLPSPRDSGLLKATGMTEVDGRPGRRFHFTGGGISLTLVIATEGPALMISSRKTGDAGVLADLPSDLSYAGHSVLTDTNTGADVAPPPGRLVIDLADFVTAPA